MSHHRAAKRTRRVLRHKLRALNAEVMAKFPGRTVYTFLESVDASDSRKYGGQWYKEVHAWSVAKFAHGDDQVCHGEVIGSEIVPYPTKKDIDT